MESETFVHRIGVPEGDSGQEGAISATASGQPTASISFVDSTGHRHQGFVLRLPRWDEAAAVALAQVGGDFRIVILGQPTEGPPPPPRAAPPGRGAGCSGARLSPASAPPP